MDFYSRFKQGAKGERQIEKRQMKMENDFHDDFSYFSDGNGGLDGFDSFDDVSCILYAIRDIIRNW